MTGFMEILVDNWDKQKLIVELNELRIIIVLMTCFKIMLFCPGWCGSVD